MGRFSDRTRVLIGAGSILSVIALLIFLATQSKYYGIVIDKQVESLSALGDRAFMEFLARRDYAVGTNTGRGLETMTEPFELHILIGRPIDLEAGEGPQLSKIGSPLIVVLPKWQAEDDPEHPGWVTEATGVPADAVATILEVFVGKATLVRPTGDVTWSTDELGFDPTLAQPQLFIAPGVTPLVAANEGILIGEIRYGLRTILILADPDLIANHGLHRGDNAALALAMTETLAPAGSAIVFDITWRVETEPPDILAMLFGLPFVIVIVQIVLLCILLGWAAAARFGSALDLPRPIATGSASLIANTSALLILGGHLREMLARYGEAVVRDVARRLHAPTGLDGSERDAWLGRVERARDIGADLGHLQRRLAGIGTARGGGDAGAIMAVAACFHQWRQEMIRGPGHHRDR